MPASKPSVMASNDEVDVYEMASHKNSGTAEDHENMRVLGRAQVLNVS